MIFSTGFMVTQWFICYFSAAWDDKWHSITEWSVRKCHLWKPESSIWGVNLSIIQTLCITKSSIRIERAIITTWRQAHNVSQYPASTTFLQRDSQCKKGNFWFCHRRTGTVNHNTIRTNNFVIRVHQVKWETWVKTLSYDISVAVPPLDFIRLG